MTATLPAAEPVDPAIAPSPYSAVPDINIIKGEPHRVPMEVTRALSDLLHRHHLDGLLASVITVLEPHLADTPVAGDDVQALIPVRVVVKLHQLMPVLPAGLAATVLTEVSPWIRAPRFPKPSGGGRTAPPPQPVVWSASARNVDDGPLLSTRELEVLGGMAAGMSNGAIGRGLYLSEDTIKTHARRMFKRMDVRDRAQAVARAYDLGILSGGS